MKFEKLENFEKDLYLLYGIRKDSVAKEPETIEWLRNLNNGTLYDIGANIGAYSLVYASLNNNCKVCSFEPLFKNYYALMENIYKNKLQNKIYGYNLAISNKNECGFLNVSYHPLSDSVDNIGTALNTYGEEIVLNNKKIEAKEKQPCFSFTMDELIKNFNFIPPDYIKLDVDGIEYKILEGSPETLKNTKSILLEAEEGFDFQRINKLLESSGFKLYKKIKHNLTSNCIFNKDDK